MENYKYDVIVAGAGNGGLSSALYLAKHGKKVLVIEKNNYPGGCATSFVKGRFEFEASLHEMCFIGSKDRPSPVRRLLEEEYKLDLNWIPVEEIFKTICNNPNDYFDISLPCGVLNFIEKLEEYFPGCKSVMMDVMEYSRMIYNTLNEYLLNLGEHKKSFPLNLIKIAHISCEEMLLKLNVPKKVRNIYESYWDYLGADPSEVSFVIYAYMMYSYINDKPWIVKYRSSEISLALDSEIKKNKGDIWYNSKVEEIVIYNKSIYGVKLTDGTFLRTNYVISNIIPHIVFGKMIMDKDVPEREIKLANARSLGACCFTIYLGLNIPYKELGVSSYNIFIRGCSDNYEQYIKSKKVETQCNLGINVLNVVNPTCSPDNTCIIQLTRLFTDDVWKNVYSIEENYVKKKEEFADSTISIFEKYIGRSIRNNIEEIVIASPVTWARYLGTPYGDIYGYSASSWDGSLVRVASSKVEDYTIKGLRFVGGHGTQLNGYSQSFLSGKEQAIYMLEEMEGEINA